MAYNDTMPTPAWTFHNPVKVVFRRGAISRLAEYVDSEHIALVTSPGFRRRGLVDNLERSLGDRLLAVVEDVKTNPGLNDVRAQGNRLRHPRPDTIIALGGGSTIDTAKALAWLVSQPEGVRLTTLFRNGLPAGKATALRIVAIPTTSGTGAEVTPFGTVWDYERKEKCSIASEALYPSLALLDPELTFGLPEEVTVSSGLDAISHALESAWNRNASPVTLGLITKSLELSMRALPRVKDHPNDELARADMMQASLLAGLAISQSRTALAHAVSYPLTATLGLPHGLACSFTLPALLEFNAAADDGRLQRLARCLGHSSIRGLVDELAELLEHLEVRAYLTRYVPEPRAVTALAEQMFAPGRAENNLRCASIDDVRTLLAKALDALRL